MLQSGILQLLSVLCFVGCLHNSQKLKLEVTYIANEGFMISMGDTKVIVDALTNTKNYAHPSDALAAALMDGVPPFDDVDYVLVTHNHADHFNAEMMSRFLGNHPTAHLIGSTEVCKELTGDSVTGRRCSAVDLKMGESRTFRRDNAEIMVIRLDHSGRDISNLAFVIRSNGYTIMHVGDALLWSNEEFLRSYDWSSYAIDLLFVEHFDRSSPTQDIIQNLIKPKHVVLMHIPAGEEESVKSQVAKMLPQPVVFVKENETKKFGD